jgi:DNA-directed RNA polymerase subunit E'/Rpb7
MMYVIHKMMDKSNGAIDGANAVDVMVDDVEQQKAATNNNNNINKNSNANTNMSSTTTKIKTNALFVRSILTDSCRLSSTQLTSYYGQYLKQILQDKYEGKCSVYGYIRNGSIEIVKVSTGCVRMFSLNGDVVFKVQFRAQVCNPLVGQVISAKVVNVNKFGILATAGLVDEDVNQQSSAFDTNVLPVIDVVIPKTGTIESDVSLSDVKQGDKVIVEILGKKFTLNDPKISAIGRVKSVEMSYDANNAAYNDHQTDDTMDNISTMGYNDHGYIGDGDIMNVDGDDDDDLSDEDMSNNGDDDDGVVGDEEQDDDVVRMGRGRKATIDRTKRNVRRTATDEDDDEDDDDDAEEEEDGEDGVNSDKDDGDGDDVRVEDDDGISGIGISEEEDGNLSDVDSDVMMDSEDGVVSDDVDTDV